MGTGSARTLISTPRRTLDYDNVDELDCSYRRGNTGALLAPWLQRRLALYSACRGDSRGGPCLVFAAQKRPVDSVPTDRWAASSEFGGVGVVGRRMSLRRDDAAVAR